jgi:hypothetical protein
MTKSKFERYVISLGYSPVLVWENVNGFHARLENNTDYNSLLAQANPSFTEVITEGMYFPVVRLSHSDALLLENNTNVLIEEDEYEFD